MYPSFIRAIIISVALLIGTSACTINQSIQPVRMAAGVGEEIVIVPKTKGVRRGFTDAYRGALENKGFSVVGKPTGTRFADYPLASTYIAKWSHDITIYMSYAEIWVYEYGKEIGHVIYKVKGGNWSMRLDKWINAESKIHELVDELFPNHIIASQNEVAATYESPNAD